MRVLHLFEKKIEQLIESIADNFIFLRFLYKSWFIFNKIKIEFFNFYPPPPYGKINFEIL